MAKNKETEKVPTKTDYGADAGDSFFSKAGTAAVGAALFGLISNKASGGNKLWTGIGGLAGAVIMHKVGPEFITDVQRGWQYVDQQKALGKSEGSLTDRFNAIFGNVKVKGQSFEPDPDLNV